MSEIKRTLKENKFIESYIENNGNATEAYLAINPEVKRENASVYGMRMLEKVRIGVEESLNKLGLTDIALIGKLKEGLEAVKTIAGVEAPDHNVRVRYLDMAFKLKNIYPASRFEGKMEIEKGEGFDYEEFKAIKAMSNEERNELIERLSKICKIDEKGELEL